MNVLIVDDSMIMRNIVKNTLISLKISDINFFEAPNGMDAYYLLESEKIDLLLLDWNMPNLNGIELVKKLRKNEKYKSLPIIMVTSEAAKYNVIEAIKEGVDDYLTKPINEKKLYEKIKRFL